MAKEKIQYIEWLRVISAIAVIGIHITMTQPNNYSIAEIGMNNYLIITAVYALVQWAVPVFLMISGNLLLHSNNMTLCKMKNMIFRMGAALLIWGTLFAMLEQIFESKSIGLQMIPKAVLMTLE